MLEDVSAIRSRASIMKALVLVCALASAGCVSAGHATRSVAVVSASRETEPMRGFGDRADDPAVWVNPGDPARSLILATNKDEGVYVYDLDGRERQRLPVGASNNIDLRGNLAVATNDGKNALSWFDVDPVTLMVTHRGDTKLDRLEPYGVCAGKIDLKHQVAVTFKDGTIDIWEVADGGVGPVAISPVRSFKLSSQLEGCVFDDEARRLFVGEEAVGVWAIDLSSDSAPALIDKVDSGSGLVAEVEGISIWLGKKGKGFIVASAQSQDRFVMYDRQPPHRVAGAFVIGPSSDGAVDGVSHTDGLDIVSQALPGFPGGVLVVQDDANERRMVDQNFKIIDWREVQKAMAIRNR
jgi:3-phytase